ncbi:probable NADH dehydrogenase [ubiquinone] 1 beta subcomplex subunit 2, mitochondrial [Topomyia yanbarensis]|uniref:probable NADH dehydrogenase [ubiquinone] 1 beta subcomplex subunit 2, mitochondrial n=1 Tax=Topomyia yanbarensis TaxID=2498891 RepID=UPI00273C67D3|nr:probable NADH dehydrogenase [ubiquinone] 1 beta subcomplex subunit 2, mitochondrial [Topomyia yanbarensis]
MLPSRAQLLGRLLQRAVASRGTAIVSKQIIRRSHDVSYRVNGPTPSLAARAGAQFAGGLMWWWVLWHLFHEYEHITGEFDYPDPSAWTNAELGIPPDDYEE